MSTNSSQTTKVLRSNLRFSTDTHDFVLHLSKVDRSYNGQIKF